LIETPCAAFVLAGGRSTRMGADKALVEFAGEPLIAHALRTLRAAGLEAKIAGARSALNAFADVVEDDGGGPLAGICASLAATDAERAVFLAVDQPLTPPSLIEALIEDALITNAAVVLPQAAGFTETFPAVVSRAALPVLREAFASGDGGCFRAFAHASAELKRPLSVVPVELLAQAGRVGDGRAAPASMWCRSVNTPAELALAERWTAGARRAIA
jgi:molybdenum cofactor guanylyltransferase